MFVYSTKFNSFFVFLFKLGDGMLGLKGIFAKTRKEPGVWKLVEQTKPSCLQK